MELNKMVYTIITLSVVVISVAAIMMPVLSDVTKTTETLTNDGLYRMSEVELSGTDEIVVTWDYTTPNVVTIDGEAYTFDDTALPASTSRTFAFCDDHLLRFSRHTPTIYGIELWYTTAQSVMTTEAVNLTVTITSDTLTWSKGSNDDIVLSTNGDWNRIDDDGDYIMKNPSATAYMLEDSYFKIAGISGVGENGGSPTMSFFCIDGTLDDFTITSPNGIAISDEVATYSLSDGYADVYELEKITFTTTFQTYEVDQTYTYFMVPYQVNGELTQHLDSGEIALLNAIPAMVFVALIVVALGVFMTARRD